MKALVVNDPNHRSIAELEFGDLTVPTPEKDQVLIKVYAVGLNPVDYKIVESGVSAWKYPHILGLDVAGKIVKVGDQVKDWKVGDRVSGHGDLTKNGCFAEYVSAPTYELAKIPDDITYETAASILCGGLTAYEAIERKANFSNVKTVLVHAGAGGVGSIAMQLAKRHGCQVFTTVSTNKIKYVKKLGADVIIDYRKQDVTKEIKRLTKGLGVDLIIDTVGKAEAEKDLARLAYNGQLVTIVDVPDITRTPMFNRALGMAVVNLGGAHLSKNPFQQTDLGRMNGELLDLVKNEEVKPLIEKVIPFDQIIEGLNEIKERKVIGKIVVRMA